MDKKELIQETRDSKNVVKIGMATSVVTGVIATGGAALTVKEAIAHWGEYSPADKVNMCIAGACFAAAAGISVSSLRTAMKLNKKIKRDLEELEKELDAVK